MAEVLLALGTRKGLFLARRDRDGTWQPVVRAALSPAGGIRDRCGRPPRSAALLVGADSPHWGPSVFRSDDLGASWHEPQQPAVRFPGDTGVSPERVWQLQPASLREPDVVYTGTQPGALFRTEDGGESFELVRALWEQSAAGAVGAGYGGQAVHTVLPDPRDADSVTVAVSSGGVYRMTDGGASWSPSPPAVRRHAAPASPPGMAAPAGPRPIPASGSPSCPTPSRSSASACTCRMCCACGPR